MNREARTKRLAQQGGHIKKLEAFNTQLEKELREAKELIVAFITSNGDIDIASDGTQTFKLYLDDAQVARVSRDDRMQVTYDNLQGGNVYRVTR